MILFGVALGELYHTSRWMRARRAFLRMHPRCAATRHETGCGGLATVVDHIVPRSSATTSEELHRLTWDRENWQPLSKPCHDAKTRSERGPREGWAPVRQRPAAIAPVRPVSSRPSRVVTADYTTRAEAS